LFDDSQPRCKTVRPLKASVASGTVRALHMAGILTGGSGVAAQVRVRASAHR
jgi:hypothetical protein